MITTLCAYHSYHSQIGDMINNLSLMLADFEAWFDRRFGWFFTNGMKDRSASGSAEEDPVQESASSIT